MHEIKQNYTFLLIFTECHWVPPNVIRHQLHLSASTNLHVHQNRFKNMEYSTKYMKSSKTTSSCVFSPNHRVPANVIGHQHQLSASTFSPLPVPLSRNFQPMNLFFSWLFFAQIVWFWFALVWGLFWAVNSREAALHNLNHNFIPCHTFVEFWQERN